MAKEGCAVSEEEIRTVISLLSKSEVTVADIAQRVSLSSSIVLEINRRFKVRDYRMRALGSKGNSDPR